MNINEKNIIEADGIEEAKQAYLDIENSFAEVLKPIIIGTSIQNLSYGTGTVLSLAGSTLDDFLIEIKFEIGIKKFSLKSIADGNRFTKFTDDTIYEKWRELSDLHIKLDTTYKTTKSALEQVQIELAKQAEAEKKAEAKFEKQKENSIRAFDNLVKQASVIQDADDFYFALGWLAKHVGTISASLPDYLESAFLKHFGPDTPARIVDSSKKTSNGNAMQWTFGFKATLRSPETAPVVLEQYFSSSKKALANTAFIWDLIETYGFTFGKKQDIDNIKSKVPAQYITTFESGLSA